MPGFRRATRRTSSAAPRRSTEPRRYADRRGTGLEEDILAKDTAATGRRCPLPSHRPRGGDLFCGHWGLHAYRFTFLHIGCTGGVRSGGELHVSMWRTSVPLDSRARGIFYSVLEQTPVKAHTIAHTYSTTHAHSTSLIRRVCYDRSSQRTVLNRQHGKGGGEDEGSPPLGGGGSGHRLV